MNIAEEIVDTIYEAALVPELWPQVLDRMAALSGTIGGILLAVSPEPGTNGAGPPVMVPHWIASDSVAEPFQTFLDGGWMQHNTRAARAIQLDHAGFLTDHDLFTPEEIEVEPMYRFAREIGLGWCAGASILPPSGDALIFDLERAYADGPVSREAIPRLDALRPHLARSALLSARLGLEKVRAATETLALLGLPAAVLSSNHRLIAANALLEALIPDVAEERAGGFMHLVDRNSDRLFAAALSDALRTRQELRQAATTVFSVPMPAREDHPAMVAHVVPVRRAARDIFSNAANIVIVTPVCPSEIPSANVLRGLFDLTAAETRVAREIAAGNTIKDIAAQTAKSEETIRTQLKAVFAKTGVTRQAELTSLLGNINPVRTAE